MLEFPPLPNTQNGIEWSAEIRTGYHYLQGLYTRARNLISLVNPDPIRANLAASDIFTRGLSLLQALEEELPEEGWVTDCAAVLFQLGSQLREVANAAEEHEHNHIQRLHPVTESIPAGRGRPRKLFDAGITREMLSRRRRISIPVLAKALKVHPNTLRKHLKSHGHHRFSEITDFELDTLMREFRRRYPKSGIRYAIGFFTRHHVRIAKRRIVGSLRRVGPVAQRIRTREAIQRRAYRNARPNSMWHIDGHHKLIHWGIVIHGSIDGHSRKIMSLRATSDNKARTVLTLFLQAVEKHGFPSRVRGDRGSENIEVSVCMILYRGPGRSSFVWGTSTHNTRIERLWVEVGTQFGRAWRAFFTRLECLHLLDRNNTDHLWLLHEIFLPEINQDCEAFIDNWNHHPVSGLGHDQTPEDMYLLGQIEHGLYEQPSEIHPSTAQQYGAAENIQHSITADLSQHVHHEAVSVPDHGSPFAAADVETVFREALAEVIALGTIPPGFLLRPAEWGDAAYPTSESIKVARKQVEIPLPFEVWYPRAVQWAQGLTVMGLVLEEFA